MGILWLSCSYSRNCKRLDQEASTFLIYSFGVYYLDCYEFIKNIKLCLKVEKAVNNIVNTRWRCKNERKDGIL